MADANRSRGVCLGGLERRRVPMPPGSPSAVNERLLALLEDADDRELVRINPVRFAETSTA